MQCPSTPLASLNGAHKHFAALHAVRGIDLQLHGGQLLALLGGNGAGKSTSIGLLLGLHRPDAGQALPMAARGGAAGDRGAMLGACATAVAPRLSRRPRRPG